MRLEVDEVAFQLEVERVALRMRADGIWVSHDLRVSAATAAYELGITEAALRNRRYLEQPPFPADPDARRPTYWLADLLVRPKKSRVA